MDASTALRLIITPCLQWMHDTAGVAYSQSAERQLIAIGLQESEFQYRTQMGYGPARGWWQFERGGGVAGVLTHPATAAKAKAICKALVVDPSAAVVHPALEQNDMLACAFARLLLFSDPKPLPQIASDGWLYYYRNWRPGKPHPAKWQACWDEAERTIRG